MRAVFQSLLKSYAENCDRRKVNEVCCRQIRPHALFSFSVPLRDHSSANSLFLDARAHTRILIHTLADERYSRCLLLQQNDESLIAGAFVNDHAVTYIHFYAMLVLQDALVSAFMVV